MLFRSDFASLDAMFGGPSTAPTSIGEATPEPEKVEEAAPVAEAPQDTPPAEPAPSPLALKIKAERERREAQRQTEDAVTGYKRQISELQEQLESVKKVDDPLSDPVGWARARGLSQEEQLLLGQSLLYDLAPNKAPADMRIRLLEAKMAREKRAEQEQGHDAGDEVREELVPEGVEGGVKSVVMNGQLRLDLTAYRYTYNNLQVSIFDPTLGSTATKNAASARI